MFNYSLIDEIDFMWIYAMKVEIEDLAMIF